MSEQPAATATMIELAGLDVRTTDGADVLRRLDLRVPTGQRVAVIGESGSGKTTLALSLLGAVRPGLETHGRVTIDGRSLLGLRPAELRGLRRSTIAYLPQDPASALTPSLRVGRQLREMMPRASTRTLAEQLTAVGLPAGREFERRYPHQLSGGQRQRLAVARALAGSPKVLVLDEPTTGLDAAIQRVVLDTVDRAVRQLAVTMVLITHDLGAARASCDRVIVLKDGQVVEDGPTDQVLTRPAAGYTRELVASVATVDEAADRVADREVDAVFGVRDLVAEHGGRSVVRDLSLGVGAGECVALAGASGSGKSTVLRCMSGLHPPSGGEVQLSGRVLARRARDRSTGDRQAVQLIGQNPFGTLNPRRTVGAAIDRVLRRLRGLGPAECASERDRLLGVVGLRTDLAGRLPRQLSGGQLQRVAIARALAARPTVLLCDEVTSDLDLRVQLAIVRLLRDIVRNEGVALVLVTHDLGVAARLADRVVVLDGGGIVEQGPAGRVLLHPRSDTTRTMLSVVPATVRPDVRIPARPASSPVEVAAPEAP